MGKSIRVAIMLAAIGACVYFSIQLPWAELDMDTTSQAIPHTLKLLKLDGVAQMWEQAYGPKKAEYNKALDDKRAEGKHGEYVYALAMGLALLAAAIGMMAVGSEEETEKTLIPQK